MVISLMVITYVPKLSLWLPVQTGQLKAEEVEKSLKAWQSQVFGAKSEQEEKSR